jgi:parvulin-like peptidyl-prolyl isomerase
MTSRGRSRAIVCACLLAAVAAAVAGCGGGSGSVSGDDVAVVGGKHVTKDAYNALVDQAARSYKAQKRPFPKPGTSSYTTLKNQAVQFLVQRAEYAQKADELGVSISSKDVEKRLAQIKKQYFGGDEKKYREQLKKQGLTEEQVKKDVEAQLVSERLFNKVTAGVRVSEKDVAAYYKAHRDQYGTPATREVRHILVPSKSLAGRLYAQLRGGADFARLAKKFSKDPGSAPNGGKMTATKGQLVPEFQKVAFGIKTGAVAPPVHTQYGYHIIEALGPVHAAKPTAFAKVKQSIRQQLVQTKKNEKMTKWVEATKAEFAKKIKYAKGFAPPVTSSVQERTE